MSNFNIKDQLGDFVIINGRHYTLSIVGTDRICVSVGWVPIRDIEIDFDKEFSRSAIDENKSAQERTIAWQAEISSLVDI